MLGGSFNLKAHSKIIHSPSDKRMEKRATSIPFNIDFRKPNHQPLLMSRCCRNKNYSV